MRETTSRAVTRALTAVTTAVAVAVVASSCSAAAGLDAANRPKDESAFLEAVTAGQDAASGDNEIKLVRDKEARGDALCSAVGPDLKVTDWVGEISQVDTTLGGDSGVLTLKVGDNVEIGTWNNGFSDMSAHSLIKKTDPLYDQLANLEEGQSVKFSGTFAKAKEECITEKSLTDVGSMRSPSFIMKFDTVDPM